MPGFCVIIPMLEEIGYDPTTIQQVREIIERNNMMHKEGAQELVG